MKTMLLAITKPLLAPKKAQFIDVYIDGLVQERHNSIADALELHLSCTNPGYALHCLDESIQKICEFRFIAEP